ncbi:GNAT family N-acetyltransferase [Azospirillum halopraeferens]|uniref:GNAT family N-acetyltransferase n=1 Tax=Azospirillum halopraeferens TaxID=34010 RepID=UPI00041C57B4|nr:GNAT family N-acetyltransferase [Azospirillum halopraeferens]
MTPPAYETARLLLRPRTPADLDACLAMDTDPDVMRHVGGVPAHPGAYRQELAARLAHTPPAGFGYWSVFVKPAPGRFIGWVVLVPHGDDPDLVEIGWRLRRDAWGNGYATEAAAVIVRHGFTSLGLTRIVADVHPDNAASARVAARLGFRSAGPALYGGEPCRRFVLDRG